MAETTISDILRAYEADRREVIAEPSRVESLTRALHRILGARPAADFGPELVADYLATRQAEGLRQSSARRELITLSAALRLANVPIPKVRLPRQGRPRTRVLTRDEVTALLEAATDPRLRMFVVLALATAARKAAICELTWDRIDLERRIIDLHAPHPRAHRRKGRAVVPISDELAEHLAAVRPANGQGRIVPVSGSTINAWFSVARKAAGLGPDVTPHVLRHTAATMMVRKVPLILASKMLGHANTAITEAVYVHLLAEDLRPAAEATGALLPALAGPEAPPPRPSLWQRLAAGLRRWWAARKAQRSAPPTRVTRPRKPRAAKRTAKKH